MQIDEIMIRYGELSTKGKNIKDFIRVLAKNVRSVLDDLDHIDVNWSRDRMHIQLNDTAHGEEVIDRLKYVFGIQNMSPAVKVEKSLEAAEDMIAQIVKDKYYDGMTFKIDTHRADHTFEYNSMELNRKLGAAAINAVPELNAKMEDPDLKIRVEVRQKAIYISTDTIQGAKGLPVGTSGKGMLMLSGGIDSPVAGYL